MNLKTMPKKHLPDPEKYELGEPYTHLGIPFPRLPATFEKNSVPLKEDYKMRSMDYLDTPEAYSLFEKQADLIIENGWKGIIDVGCRHGPVVDILMDKGYTDFNYMGFDTSAQPIEYAQETWQEFDNIEYRVMSWNEFAPAGASKGHKQLGQNNKKETDEEWWSRAGVKFKVDFHVDVMIWSGVLLYEPTYHLWFFHNMHNAYGAQNAIIQEPLKDQRPECWREDLELNTIEHRLHMYKTKYYEYESWEFDLDIFSGRRIISRVKLWQDGDSKWEDWVDTHGQLAANPHTEILPSGYKVIPYIFRGKLNFELSQRDQTLCQVALEKMFKERHSHRLADNYSRDKLHLGKMYMYNFVFDGDEPVFCSGVQNVTDKVVRVFSRYFAFEKYKTDGTTLLEKNDNFEELQYAMHWIRDRIIFWSRDKSPKFFERLKVKNELFSEWTVHPTKINIIYPNNEQYIFYTPKVPAEWWKNGNYDGFFK
jgi:hypothetical protein|tara:strand:- start:4694 stop:6133 length:1440 start_codon:yes stop_codon:yes gene_type:complete